MTSRASAMTRPRRWGVLVGAACAAVALPRLVGAAYRPDAMLDARRQLYATTYAWSDQHQVMRVTTVDAAAHQQERTVELWERRYGDGQRKVLLVFLAPDNVKGMAVLSQERRGGAPERWLYLPRQKRARRFAGQMQDEGLLGTDLTAGELDLMRETLGWSSAELRPTVRGPEPIDGADAYGFEVAGIHGYQRIVLWVGADDLVMRRLELYGPAAGVSKRIRQSAVRFVGAVPIPARVEVENPGAGTRSVFEVVEVEVDRGFSDDVFSLPLLAVPNKE
jgi:Outer membrane lipoprotein-sorting protein